MPVPVPAELGSTRAGLFFREAVNETYQFRDRSGWVLNTTTNIEGVLDALLDRAGQPA